MKEKNIKDLKTDTLEMNKRNKFFEQFLER